MKYHLRQFRFKLSVLILSILLAICLDTYPLVKQLFNFYKDKKVFTLQYENDYELVKHQQIISLKLNEIRKKTFSLLRFDNPSAVAAELMTAILRASEMNGVLIYSIQPEEWQHSLSANTLPIHLLAKSHFLQFIEFLQYLTQYSLPIAWQDFSFHLDKNGMGTIDLQLTGMYVPVRENKYFYPSGFQRETHFDVQKTRDPFESADPNSIELTNQISNTDLSLQSVSLQQIEWVGYLHNNEQFWALVQLPSGNTVAVSQGMQIGLEKAIISKLSENKIVLYVANRQMIMRYKLNQI